MRSFDITIEVPSRGGRAKIAATVHRPDEVAPDPVVMVALPGGGYSRGYFDMRFPGHAGYSQAEHHTARGIVLIAIDHLGFGDSSTDNLHEITIEDIADADHAAVRIIRDRLTAGKLGPDMPAVTPRLLVGTGQSVGGGATMIMQGRHRTYDAIAPLGYSAIHTVVVQPTPAATEAIKAAYAHLNRKTRPQDIRIELPPSVTFDFRYPWHWEDVPADILEADMAGGYPIRQTAPAWGSVTMPICLSAMMAPGYVAEEADLIDVPVFMGFGERDTSPDPHREPTAFPKSRDVTVFVAPRMAHMHNFASTRALLWDRLAGWAAGV